VVPAKPTVPVVIRQHVRHPATNCQLQAQVKGSVRRIDVVSSNSPRAACSFSDVQHSARICVKEIYESPHRNVLSHFVGRFHHSLRCHSTHATERRDASGSGDTGGTARWDASDTRSSRNTRCPSDGYTTDNIARHTAPCNACDEGHTGHARNIDNGGDSRDTRGSGDTGPHNERFNANERYEATLSLTSIRRGPVHGPR
jgi:hypothetical protein